MTIGGPGAIFWMWIAAMLGAATGYVEAVLAQCYKREDETAFIGGPALTLPCVVLTPAGEPQQGCCS